jgi:hypothetical protein
MRRLLHFLSFPFLLAGMLRAGEKPAAGPAPPPRMTVYRGMCDASGASVLDPGHFIVGNDEDNVLRVYETGGGDPVKTVPFDDFMELSRNEKNTETDIEASARIGDDIFWMGSHGRNTEGKIRSNRQRFFAVRATRTGAKTDISSAGHPYSNLIFDMLGDPKLAGLGLAEAAQPLVKRDPGLAPKKRGLNIEGLSRMPGTRALLIGFRNPAPGGMALLIPLLNPEGMLFGEEKASFGDPVRLDLRGLSIRDIAYVDCLGAYFIIAGPRRGGDDFELYTWSGKRGDRALRFPFETDWMREAKFTPEALAVFPETRELLLISDDGTLPLRAAGSDAACPCKRLANPEDRHFRGVWVRLKKR